jgi:hypothetical protein
MAMGMRTILVALALASTMSTNAPAQQGQTQGQSGASTLKDTLAAQIRLQGFSCERPLGATRDAKLSRPDRGVWVLKCENARYRVSRAPDMSAAVERLK